MGAPLHKVVKQYPPRGPLQQVRLESAIGYSCFRCAANKQARLICLYEGSWGKLLCNGCYGYLLSVYDIVQKEGSSAEKAEQLSELLLWLASEDDRRVALERSGISIARSEWLSDRATQFLGTSEFVATQMAEASGLEWSPPIIGLCKAVELEVTVRLIEPARGCASSVELTDDMGNRDLGNVARYLSGRSTRPIELGAVAHFLTSVVKGKAQVVNSATVRLLKQSLANMVHDPWLLSSDGASHDIGNLASQYRNRAAHTATMTRGEYIACKELVAGDHGLLWKLVAATRLKAKQTGHR